MKQLMRYVIPIIVLASAAVGGSLRGVVRDAESLSPLLNCKVTVHVVNPDSIAFPAVTDQLGAYSITGIVPNNKIYAIVVNQEGYLYSYTRIDSLGSLDLVYDIVLTSQSTNPPGGAGDSVTMTGTILRHSSQPGSLQPVANAQIGLASGSQQFTLVTNTQGRYSINIPSGYYLFTVNAAGYKSIRTSGLRIDTAGTSMNVILQQSATSVGSTQDRTTSVPEKIALLDAYPNPWNPSTTVQFSIPERGWAAVRLFNILGCEMAVLARGEFAGAVKYAVKLNATMLNSGVYFIRLEYKDQLAVKKLVLVK